MMSDLFSIKDHERMLLDLLLRASTQLPPDVHKALEKAECREDPDSPAAMNLKAILKNIRLAEQQKKPLCQDTGLPHFYIEHPPGISQRELKDALENAVIKATELGYLRPNAVDPLSGKNSGNNLGRHFPHFRFTEHDGGFLRIRCMLKGGGSENVSAQYNLPDTALSAGRNIGGVQKCVVDAVYHAQGKGCAPGIIGVGIGGDRCGSMQLAKEQLLRELGDHNPDAELAAMEEALYQKLNTLGIGPMGLGGKTTVLGVKAGKAHRLPACYFVSIAYMCWACRKAEVRIGFEK
jgi:fumarate hydratase, class I